MQAVRATTSERLDGREHADADLVASELAIAVGVDDAVGAQGGGELGGVDAGVEVDRGDDGRALGGVGDEGRRPCGRLGPAVEVLGRGRRALGAGGQSAELEHPRELVGEQHQRGRPPACCTSGRDGCCRGRWRGRATPAASVPRRRCDRCARSPPANRRRSTGRRRRRSTSAGRSSTRRRRPGPTAGRRPPTWRRRGRAGRRSRPSGRRSCIATPVDVSLWVRA